MSSATTTTTTSNTSATPTNQLVNYLPSIVTSQKVYKYVKIIDSELDSIYNLNDFKLSPALTHAVCNLIEYLVGKNNKYNIDKKQLSINYLTQKFDLTPEEQAIVTKQIDFIIELGAVSSIPVVKKICLYLKSKFITS